MSNEALLVMDVQRGITSRFNTGSDELLKTIKKVVEAARDNDVLPIFIRVAFRPGGVEINTTNKLFANISTSFTHGSEDIEIDKSCGVREDDLIIDKKRVSAFSGSGLALVLRSQKIDTLTLCGIATSGVVLSTLRQAADLDFKLNVISDCCLDADPLVHSVLLEKVFPRQSEVLTSNQYIEQLVKNS